MPKVNIFYVAATQEGEFPTAPTRNSATCIAQLDTCRKFKPDATWKTFKLNQVRRGDFGLKTFSPLMVEATTPVVEATLIQQLKERHPVALRKLGVEV